MFGPLRIISKPSACVACVACGLSWGLDRNEVGLHRGPTNLLRQQWPVSLRSCTYPLSISLQKMINLVIQSWQMWCLFHLSHAALRPTWISYSGARLTCGCWFQKPKTTWVHNQFILLQSLPPPLYQQLMARNKNRLYVAVYPSGMGQDRYVPVNW